MIALRARHRVAFRNRELLIVSHRPGRSGGFLASAALLIVAAAVGFDPAADLAAGELPGLVFYAGLVLATLGAGCWRHQLRFDARARVVIERAGLVGLQRERRCAPWDAIQQVTLEWRARPSRLPWAFARRTARQTAPTTAGSALLTLTVAPGGGRWRVDEAAGDDEVAQLGGAIADFLGVPLHREPPRAADR